jgi:hypothetical protein
VDSTIPYYFHILSGLHLCSSASGDLSEVARPNAWRIRGGVSQLRFRPVARNHLLFQSHPTILSSKNNCMATICGRKLLSAHSWSGASWMRRCFLLCGIIILTPHSSCLCSRRLLFRLSSGQKPRKRRLVHKSVLNAIK